MLPSAGIVCLVCNRSVLRRERQNVTRNVFESNPAISAHILASIAPRQVIFNGREYVCRPCWLRSQRSQGQGAMQDPLPGPSTPREDAVGNIDQDEVQQPDLLQSLNLSELSRAPNTANACIFYGCRMISRRRITERVKGDFLIKANYYVPPSARVCDEHMQSNNWEELFQAPNISHDFSSEHIMDIISILKNVITKKTHMDFEHVENMSADELHYWTGRTLEEFNVILAETPSLSRRSTQPKKILGMYLSKLRSGESDDRLATLYGISRRHFERLLHLAQECLLEDFVPQHLGFDHLTRQQAVNRNLVIPAALFGNPNEPENEMPAITIIDGTYQNIQKSANFLFQRDTYSPHKYRNLIKPLVLTCSDGYIIDIYGPYKATKSDANIMEDVIHDEQDVFHYFFRPGDIFILDKGFRDALPDFRSFGYITHTPESLHPGETQLTTMQANKSRKVTMVRWVVEIVFGRIKRDFKLLRQEYFNVALKHLFPNFRIAAALLNAFHMPVHDSVYAHRFIEIINQRMNMPNNLAEYVTASNMNRRRAAFTAISGDLPELRGFPRLSEEDLIIFALGTYQLKLARSYYSEHVRGGIYSIDIYRDGAPPAGLERHNITEPNLTLLRGRIQSRHVRSRTYYTYIMYGEEAAGLDSIRYYYCSCRTGKRTLGVCAHIMTIVWYLGWARYQDQIRHPAEFLNHILI